MLLSVKVVLVKYLVLTLGSICGEHVKAEGIPDRVGEAMGKQKQKIETWHVPNFILLDPPNLPPRAQAQQRPVSKAEQIVL